MPSERISKKRIKVLANNLQKTNLGEMQKVVEELFLEHDMDPVYLKGLLSGTAAMIEDEPLPIYGAPGFSRPEPKPPKQLLVFVSGVVNYGMSAATGHNYIQFIKALREYFRWGLKEAKYSADMVCGEGGGYLLDEDRNRVVFEEKSEELKEFKNLMRKCGARVKTVDVAADEE